MNTKTDRVTAFFLDTPEPDLLGLGLAVGFCCFLFILVAFTMFFAAGTFAFMSWLLGGSDGSAI